MPVRRARCRQAADADTHTPRGRQEQVGARAAGRLGGSVNTIKSNSVQLIDYNRLFSIESRNL